MAERARHHAKRDRSYERAFLGSFVAASPGRRQRPQPLRIDVAYRIALDIRVNDCPRRALVVASSIFARRINGLCGDEEDGPPVVRKFLPRGAFCRAPARAARGVFLFSCWLFGCLRPWRCTGGQRVKAAALAAPRRRLGLDACGSRTRCCYAVRADSGGWHRMASFAAFNLARSCC
jgi:hypothetical protein